MTADKTPCDPGATDTTSAEVDAVLGSLLAEISKEDVPERIRKLAQQLDRALKGASTKG